MKIKKKVRRALDALMLKRMGISDPEKRLRKNPAMKVYYFYCKDCKQKKPVAEEAALRRGVCKLCYATLPKYEAQA